MAKTPVNRETIKRLVDALTPMSPDMAEKFVQDLLRVAQERRRDLERVVGEVAKAGVRTAEGVASSVQQELSRQMTKMAARIDDLEKQVDSLSATLEATKASLLALASRTLDKTEVPVSDVPKKKRRSKDSKKADKKAAKRADSESAAPADRAGSATSPESGQSDSSPAVAGI